MSTRSDRRRVADARVLVVGAGGLGAPLAEALVRAGVGTLRIADDDRVEASNLHRQLLFDADDVGAPKAQAAGRRLEAIADDAGTRTRIEPVEARFLPSTSESLLEGVDLVVEGTDNFASKFLVADACALAGTPAVQAGAVRWGGWALASGDGLPDAHGLCLRCVFEDVPGGQQETCDAAGVVGPVVGVVGALGARLALERLAGDRGGRLLSYDGLAGTLRELHPMPRAACPHARGAIDDLRPARYAPSTERRS